MLTAIQRRMPSPYVFGPHSPVANRAGAYPGGGPVDGGGGGGGMASAFRQSLDNERAINAQGAATFAASAPGPKTDGESAYGSVAASQAAKNAYVARQRNVANAQNFAGMGTNYFRNQEVEDQAIGRENAESGARVSLMGAQGNLLNAQGQDLATKGRVLYPGQAALLNAQAAGANAEAQRTTLMAPAEAAAAAAAARSHNAAAAGQEAILPFIAPQERAKTELQQGMVAPMIQGAYDQARDTAAMNKRQHQLLSDEENFVRQKATGPEQGGAPAADPVEDATKRSKAAQEMGERDYNNQNWWQRNVTGFSKSEAVTAANAQLDKAARQGQPKRVTPDVAKSFLARAGGDRAKARQMAQQAGYTF